MRLLGAGGMAEVWLAKRADGAFKRDVALKLPSLTWVRPRSGNSALRASATILASLEHPHIARLLRRRLRSPQGLPYLSMEYVQGEFADGPGAMRSIWDCASACDCFLQILEAVQYAHDRHVIHRDLKPSNILVTAEGQGPPVGLRRGDAVGQRRFGRADTAQPRCTDPALTPVYSSPRTHTRRSGGRQERQSIPWAWCCLSS